MLDSIKYGIFVTITIPVYHYMLELPLSNIRVTTSQSLQRCSPNKNLNLRCSVPHSSLSMGTILCAATFRTTYPLLCQSPLADNPEFSNHWLMFKRARKLTSAMNRIRKAMFRNVASKLLHALANMICESQLNRNLNSELRSNGYIHWHCTGKSCVVYAITKNKYQL